MSFQLIRRVRLAGLILGAAAAFVGGAATAQAATKPDLSKVTLNVQVETTGGWDLMLQTAGLDNTPYKINWVRLATGNLAVQAIAAGAVDIGRTSDIPPIFSPPGIRIIGVQHIGYANVPGGFTVLARAGSGITSAAQLRGRKIGYTQGNITQYILLRILKQGGLTWKDITPVNLSYADGLAALQSGSIDALATFGQVAQLAIQSGASQVGDFSKSLTSGNTLTVASPAAIADPGKRAAIADLTVRLAKAVAWEYHHPIAWIKAQSTAEGTDFNQSDTSWKAQWRGGGDEFRNYTAADVAAEQDVADQFYAAGATPTHVNVKPLWSTIFKKANNEAAALAQKAPK